MQGATSDSQVTTETNVKDKFLENFITNKPPAHENAVAAGNFCRQTGFDVYDHLHKLVQSSHNDDHYQAAQIMHHLGITAPRLCNKVNLKSEVRTVSGKIKNYFGQHNPIRDSHLKAFEMGYS